MWREEEHGEVGSTKRKGRQEERKCVEPEEIGLGSAPPLIFPTGMTWMTSDASGFPLSSEGNAG